MEDSRSQRPEERKEGKDKGRLSVMYTPACLLGHVCFWLTYNLGIRGRDFCINFSSNGSIPAHC